MAVADLGVAIGPRNRRRISAAAAVVGVIAAGAVVVFLVLMRPSNHPARGTSATSTRVPGHPVSVTEKLVYGMGPSEVVRRVGRPTRTVGACWQYDENLKIRGGQNTLNAERVCFLGGVYSYSYSEIDGKWYYPTTPLTIGS